MSRLSPRVSTDAKALLLASPGNKEPVRIVDIGMGGAGLNLEHGRHPSKKSAEHLLKIEYAFKDREKPVAFDCAVVHRSSPTTGVSFLKIDSITQQRLWQQISGLIQNDATCAYCGTPLTLSETFCHHCLWALNYQSRDYFAYWERECLLRGVTAALKNLSTDELYRIKNHLAEGKPPYRSYPEWEPLEEFVGVSQSMKTVFAHIRKVAPIDLPVLILGESGTGKELTARAILERSHRKTKPWVVINCSAIPESLIESELFGHTKGAFTGAIQAKKGKFEEAHTGTLFLDEIGDLPLALQPKILRFLEDKTIYRIGSVRGRTVDARIISATNADLDKAIQNGLFRQDLFHRLASFTIQLPPLRERDACKEVLAKYFFKKIKMERNWKCKGFSTEALNAICNHTWPGNVRELINRIRRAVVLQDDWIRPEDMQLKTSTPVGRLSSLKTTDVQHKRQQILSALQANHFNISHTARSLGVSRPYVYTLIKKLDIPLAPRKTGQ